MSRVAAAADSQTQYNALLDWYSANKPARNLRTYDAGRQHPDCANAADERRRRD